MIISKTTQAIGQTWKPGFFNNRQHAHMTKHIFNADLRPQKAYHYVFQSQLGDNANDVYEQIKAQINKHKRSLVFLTQKSRIQIQTTHGVVPLPRTILDDIDLYQQAVTDELLSPEPGHTSMVITDHHGKIRADTSVSLRKGVNTPLKGESRIHKPIYKKKLILPVSLAKHTSFDDEIKTLAKGVTSTSPITGALSTIEAHVTAIPIAHSKTELEEIEDNIKRVKSMFAYNLGTLIIKKEDIDKIEQKHTRDYVRELVIHSEGLTGNRLQQLLSISGSEYVIAASACTNGILLAATGNAFPNVPELSWDPATQDAVVYAIIKLTGIHQFREFAKEIGFLDKASELTQPRSGV